MFKNIIKKIYNLALLLKPIKIITNSRIVKFPRIYKYGCVMVNVYNNYLMYLTFHKSSLQFIVRGGTCFMHSGILNIPLIMMQ